jgi:hypothetical protein
MSKRVRIQVSGSLGADLTTVTIYHTAVSSSNVLTGSITASELNSGILFDVADNLYTFIARSDDGKCVATTGSISVQNAGNTRFFSVNSDGDGSVQINAPEAAAATTSSLAQSVNFNIHSSFTIEATTTGYGSVVGDNFQGWYHVPSGSSSPTQIASSSTLSITNTTFTGSDDFYAYFS